MTPKLETLVKFEADVLRDVGVFDATGEGLLSYMADDIPKPVVIANKRLCLTTREILSAGQWDNRIAFSPLSEQISQGPSPVLNAFKEYVQLRLKETFKAVALGLMELAIDTKRHKGLKADAAKFLTQVVEADQKTYDTLVRVLNAVAAAPEKRLVSLFLKNGGENGALRSCVVSFPIMDDAAEEDTTTFFGVKMARKTKDKHLIVALLEYVLGSEEERKSFTKSSSDGEAPYFHSLLLSFHAMATRLNKLIDTHKAGVSQLADVRFELAWTEQLVDFTNFASAHSRAVPALPGNRGKERDEAAMRDNDTFEQAGEDVGLGESRRDDRDLRDRLLNRREDRDGGRDRDRRDEGRRDRGRDDRDEISVDLVEGGGSSLADVLRNRREEDDRDRDRGRYNPRDRDRNERQRSSRHSGRRGSRSW